ncbi:MAG: threonine synthase [Candidatus Pelagibacter sp.]|nr:threonine synthase [Candidatus Pelagibacter sp.]OUV96807.1 MAG: threonine synthase [Candidatus Pelagibacter sp. TMED142]
MKYISTRNSQKKFSFEEIFFKGLADDGGLFIPEYFYKLNEKEILNLKEMSFQEISHFIFLKYSRDTFESDELYEIINKAYKNFRCKNIINVNKHNNINLVQLFHGPTLAFKDVAMQVLGQMYKSLLNKNKRKITIITATSGDTGAAAINAFKDNENINIFVLHPNNKISDVQRKLMTTTKSKNIFNIAIEGNFDDCQKLVKEMFVDVSFSKKINMSGVNSINWGRIVAQTTYYFYVYSKFVKDKNELIFSVPTGNFGDIYAGHVAKKMGLPINKLIVATNQNNILERCLNTGKYKPEKVNESLSPSMDIQVSSNFERVLYDYYKKDEKKINELMKNLKDKGEFTIDENVLKNIRKDFDATSCSDDEICKIIKDFYNINKIVIDPHTATALKILNNENYNKKELYVLETAHHCKFPNAIKKALNINTKLPDFIDFTDAKENFDVLDNEINIVKDHILSSISC